MILADVISQADSVLPQYGLAGLVIFALVFTVIVQYKDNKSKDKLNESLQLARLEDAKETRDKLTESMEQQALLSRQIYDIVVSNTGRRR